ncbi:MAG: DeoR/GlpR family DNA-binding transcription regulator [Alphaproteobacteria bacterium]|nr:DeoR/GlpR family DNA-binding transcription regulator [Alphaproteobacteria bacterium]
MSEHLDLAAVRRQKIALIVRARGSMGIRDLSEEFGVSEATIRRDLRALDDGGVVVRTHGGVLVNSNVMVDLPNEERKSVGAEEKRRIGEAAIEMLSGDEVVFLDAGTTAHAVAAYAHKKPGCNYVTTSLGVANQLQAQGISNFYMIGGAYQPVNDSFTGTLAISALRGLSFDIAFLCCSAVDVHKSSISVASEAYSQVQKEVILNSRRRFVVADSSKFKSNAFMRTARFDQITGIITNVELDEGTAAQVAEANLELLLV